MLIDPNNPDATDTLYMGLARQKTSSRQGKKKPFETITANKYDSKYIQALEEMKSYRKRNNTAIKNYNTVGNSR